MSDDLARVITDWAMRRSGLGKTWFAVGPRITGQPTDDGGTPAVDFRDSRTGNERIYRVKFTRRGARLVEYKLNAKGHWVWMAVK